jgi:squalene-associated FAD-dependent desaturase
VAPPPATAARTALRVAVLGAGWAGLAAAVRATQAGHQVSVWEAAAQPGGRARSLGADTALPNGQRVRLDNGQHILIGAYTHTLDLMRQVGVEPRHVLRELPLSLRFADGRGLHLPDLPAPWDVAVGLLRARGWALADKLRFLRTALDWQHSGFVCPPQTTVAALCAHLPACIQADLIEPLCVSALNTPMTQASAQVFLRVLQDALLGAPGASRLLLPRTDLGEVFPNAAWRWLQGQGARLHLGQRVSAVQTDGNLWWVGHAAQRQPFDAVILAFSASNAALALTEWAQAAPDFVSSAMRAWAAQAAALRHEAIATVYAWGEHARLPAPILALNSTAQRPAQFVLDRGQLGGPAGLLAFVVSASQGGREVLAAQVLAQAQACGLAGLRDLLAVQAIVEKRATFACTPGLQRPGLHVAPGLWACGDYVAGPYPATLEGAVRSGLAAADALNGAPI